MPALDITGHYEVQGLQFSIDRTGGVFVMREPGVPDGYEPTLDRIDDLQMRVASGPLAGVELDFTVDGGTVTGAMAGGVIPIDRIDRPPAPTPGAGLQAPRFALDESTRQAFRGVWEGGQSARRMAVPPGYQLHVFVQWLMSLDTFIFHGSTRTEITEFQPRRESMEIGNVGGHGNLGAVYGTHDGLWAMFFSIVDRAKLRGSIRNGVGSYTSRIDGSNLDLYRFSIEQKSLAQKPFINGALYVLARESFERIPLYPGGPASNEWACFEPVEPVATILVDISDFPFLDQIAGHDDGPLVELSEVGEKVYSCVADAVRLESGIRLIFDGTLRDELRDRWIELGREMYPDVSRTLVDPRTVDLEGPEAFVHSIERQFSHLIGDGTGS